MSAPLSSVKTVSPSRWVSQPEGGPAENPRLIVVVAQASEPAILARGILALTSNRTQPILLLGVAQSTQGETELRRNLVAVEGFLASQGCRVDLKTESGAGWLERVASECRGLDQVACYEEQNAKSLTRQPLSDALARAVRVPVRDLTDLSSPVSIRRPLLPQAAAWIGSIALIAGFLVLQAKVILEMQGWAQNVLLLLTLVPELGLIWLWNSILG